MIEPTRRTIITVEAFIDEIDEMIAAFSNLINRAIPDTVSVEVISTFFPLGVFRQRLENYFRTDILAARRVFLNITVGCPMRTISASLSATHLLSGAAATELWANSIQY